MSCWFIIASLLSICYGFAIGQNDAANSFGDWIGARVGKVRTGLVLCAIFALLGAVIEGGTVVKTIGGGIVPAQYITEQVAVTGILASIVWVLIASWKGFPISTTHAAVGGIGGVGAALICFGDMPTGEFRIQVVYNIVLCWLSTPTASFVLAFLIALIVLRVLGSLALEERGNQLARVLLTLSSSYVAYTWGANDVANSVALLVGSNMMSPLAACSLGGVSIGLGAVLCGHRVAETVGFRITQLTPTMGVIADLSTALTVHFFTRIGIPVSTTHALVGAIAGVGMARGRTLVDLKVLRDIVGAWILTPVLTFAITFLLFVVFRLIAF